MFCSVQDHEAGFKDIEITYRSGRKEVIRLTAPSRRAMRQARLDLIQSGDPWPIVQLAVGQDRDERWLDKLDGASADLVECTAFALAFGVEWEKKMLSAAQEQLEKATRTVQTPATPPNRPSTPSAPR